MLKPLKKTNNKGFTIIEVMIVLAIAGLILLIVFLAVPALQRNARNTQRKNEAGALSAAYSEYVNNHGGAAPTANTDVTDNAKLNFYAPANVTLVTVTAAGSLPAAPNTDSAIILVNAKCDPQGTYSTTQSAGNAVGLGKNSVGYSSRGGVLVYTTEGGTSNTTTCISAN
jgi:prepilin-type N-terminal cleavage/methylation domain-containing protein